MNSKTHLYFSLTKSAIRILGATYALFTNDINVFLTSIIVAEFLGVFEEFGDKR